jgi:hypothetical protein
MSEERTYHIILLPQENYWAWVEAVREYAVHFQVGVTPDPQNVVETRQPGQVITVLNPANGYPLYGDIARWLGEQAPGSTLDVLDVDSPEEAQAIMAGRVAADQRLGSTASVVDDPGSDSAPTTVEAVASEFTMRWPTDYPTVTQGFGVNPRVYRRWGLPGHDGIDIYAPRNANVYACADGEVYRVHDGTGGHSYGIHVRIAHIDGYRTIYGHLNRALVHSGQRVKAGDVIGLADGTGNSAGNQLHLTLKKKGATAAGLTTYPGDIIDPTPFLEPLDEVPTPSDDSWVYGRALVGLHGRVDGPMQEADWSVVEQARIEALKLTSSAPVGDVARAREINPGMFILVRLSADLQGRKVGAAEYARWVEPDLERFSEQGVSYFEIHNEPNLTPEGFGTNWRSGYEFGEWFVQVCDLLKAKYPEVKLGWPGLAPGPSAAGMRADDVEFLQSAGSSVGDADWIGCHCYWEDRHGIASESGGAKYVYYRDRWPDRLLIITEFSNPSALLDSQSRTQQYLDYYFSLRSQAGIGAAFAFAVSASANYPFEVWRGEDGQMRIDAEALGARSF